MHIIALSRSLRLRGHESLRRPDEGRAETSKLVHGGAPAGTGKGVGQREFEQSYRARTANAPGIGAFEAYEAVRLGATGLRVAGANRALLRDYFAKVASSARRRR